MTQETEGGAATTLAGELANLSTNSMFNDSRVSSAFAASHELAELAAEYGVRNVQSDEINSDNIVQIEQKLLRGAILPFDHREDLESFSARVEDFLEKVRRLSDQVQLSSGDGQEVQHAPFDISSLEALKDMNLRHFGVEHGGVLNTKSTLADWQQVAEVFTEIAGKHESRMIALGSQINAVNERYTDSDDEAERLTLLKEYSDLVTGVSSLHVRAVQSMVSTCSEIVDSVFPGMVRRGPELMAIDLQDSLKKVDDLIVESDSQLSPAANEDNYAAWAIVETVSERLRQISEASLAVTPNGANPEQLQNAYYLQKLTSLAIFQHAVPRNGHLDASSNFAALLEDVDPRVRVMAAEVTSRLEVSTAEMLRNPELIAAGVSTGDIRKLREDLLEIVNNRLITGGGMSSAVPINEIPEEERNVLSNTRARLCKPVEALT